MSVIWFPRTAFLVPCPGVANPPTSQNTIIIVKHCSLAWRYTFLRFVEINLHGAIVQGCDLRGDLLMTIADTAGRFNCPGRWQYEPVDIENMAPGYAEMLFLPNNDPTIGGIDANDVERLWPR